MRGNKETGNFQTGNIYNNYMRNLSRDSHNGRDTSRYSCSSRVSGTNVSYSSNFSAIKSNLLKFKNKKTEETGVRAGNITVG